jgi:acyl-lipid omega-6 desaturase (Delta-12 desaturase)
MADDDRELISKTRAFATESSGTSWWVTLSTATLLAGSLAISLHAPTSAGGWALRVCASLLAALLTVRAFILFHDYWHGAILRRSLVAKLLFWGFGVLVLTPPRVWRDTHNYHHAHTAKLVGSNIGSYMMVTTGMWAKMSSGQRTMYRIIRHPLTILGAYFTVFMYGMCVAPLLRAPKKNASAVLTLVVHAGIIWFMVTKLGVAAFLFGYFLPLALAMAIGGYVFYAQHNFPDAYVQPRETWNFTRAALESSSYLVMGPVMNYFTGNIGYHHVHHLNAAIPFYRLPEAMQQVEELQRARKTTLHPRDIIACFAQKLWDPESGQMVGYPANEGVARLSTPRVNAGR